MIRGRDRICSEAPVYRLSVLALVLATPSMAGKPTSAEACSHLVGKQASAYGVALDAMTAAPLEGACLQAFDTADKKLVKQEIACVLDASTAEEMGYCGELAGAALRAANPFEPKMREACLNQVKVSEAYAGVELDQGTRAQMLEGCMRDMGLQVSLQTPEDMVRKTECMRTAADQAASERCWQ